MLDNGVWNNDLVVTHMADGEGWRTTIKFVNLSQVNAAAFAIYFFGNDGNPVVFPFSGSDIIEGPGNYSSFTASLEPGGSITIQTAGGSSLTEGFGLLEDGASFQSSPNVSGYGIFTYQNGSEAVVPFESVTPRNPGQVFAFDNTNGYGVGVALVNLTKIDGAIVPITVTAYFYAETGTPIGSPQSFTMTAGQHPSIRVHGFVAIHGKPKRYGVLRIHAQQSRRVGLDCSGIEVHTERRLHIDTRIDGDELVSCPVVLYGDQSFGIDVDPAEQLGRLPVRYGFTSETCYRDPPPR